MSGPRLPREIAEAMEARIQTLADGMRPLMDWVRQQAEIASREHRGELDYHARAKKNRDEGALRAFKALGNFWESEPADVRAEVLGALRPVRDPRGRRRGSGSFEKADAPFVEEYLNRRAAGEAPLKTLKADIARRMSGQSLDACMKRLERGAARREKSLLSSPATNDLQ